MATSSLAEVAVGFEWTPFSRGYVYWENPIREYLPPADETGQRERLKGFLLSHAEHPDNPFSYEGGESASDALRRILAGQCDVDALLALLNRMLKEWHKSGEFRRMLLQKVSTEAT